MPLQNCLITGGYQVPCSSIGGVETLWIGNFSGGTTYYLDADNVITGATNSPGVYAFNQEVEVAGVAQTIEVDRSNLSAFFITTVSLRLHNYDKNVRNRLVQLLRAPLVTAIKSNDGLYYYAGLESAGRLITGDAGTGVAYSDMNGAMIEIEFRSKNGIFLLDAPVLGTDIAIL